LKEKSEVAEKLSQFLAETKTVGHVIKELLSDNGKEFDNKDVRSMLQKEGIIQRLTMPYTPQQNGCSERENRTVVETARAIMHAHGNIPQTLWAEIVRSANYILNRTGPSNVPGTSPYELWYGKKPGLKHLRVIGSTCYVHVPKQTRKKMDPKATKGILIGYDHDDKPASFFLGLEINREEDGSVRVSQTHYTEKLLERFNMSNCKAVTTPIVKDNDTEESSRNSEFPYRQAVGALMFLMCGTRPDIAYALSVVSRNLENPTDRDVVRVKRILRYLRGTTNCGLLYKNNQAKGVFECYSDADHGGDLSTGRSTSGVLCLHSGAPISWMSQRQSSVAISTTEAEVVAASEAAREIIWIKRILTELDQLKAIPTLQIDNEAAIRLAQNPEFHRRTKHIRIRHFFVRELVTAGEIMVSKVDSEKQLADILTKPLFSTRFRDLCNDMGICKLLNKGEC
jgi:hypothetical protein